VRFRIVSAFPGRVRIRLDDTSGRVDRLTALADRLSAIPAAIECRAIADASSVLLRYAAEERDLAGVLRDVGTAATAADACPPVSRLPQAGGPKQLCLPPPTPDEPRLKRAGGPFLPPAEVMHSLPRRLRARLARLRIHPDAAARLETSLTREPGICGIEVQPRSGNVIVCYDPAEYAPREMVHLLQRHFVRALEAHPEDAVCSAGPPAPPQERQAINPLLMPTVAVGLAVGVVAPPLIAGSAVALASLPVLGRAVVGARERRFNVDQLDFSALVVLTTLGDFLTAGIMTWLIGLGDVIRARTARRARRAISELMSPASHRAWVERDGTLVSVPLDSLQPGETVVVYPGDQVPVDGVVVKGRAIVDQKVLTGESRPVTKEPGDPVFALTMVADGQIAIQVEHIGRETRAGRVVEMIDNAPLSDTRIQNYAARVGDRLVAPIFALGGVTYLLTADAARTAAILILDFVTGIRVSAPTTILSAMTGAARTGLFIKGGRAMEKLAYVDAVVFDKTGTLTRGAPFVTAARSFDPCCDDLEVLRLAASAEANLKHPAARAIVDAAMDRDLALVSPDEMEYVLGLGVRARVEGRELCVGSRRFLEQLAVNLPANAVAEAHDRHASGDTVVYVAVEGRLAGLLAYSDPPRPECGVVIQGLRDRRVRRLVMLTGDSPRVAHSVAERLGITDVVAEAFPEQKAEVVEDLKRQGYTVAVIGDGINDSPAFTRADVSISLQHGADVAKETADVILLDGDLRGLPRAMDLSREAMRILQQNVNIIIGPTAVGMGAALLGVGSPMISTLINNGTTVVTGLNAIRPLFSADLQGNGKLSALPASTAPPSGDSRWNSSSSD
jgi:Cu2+-exporting ATPase